MFGRPPPVNMLSVMLEFKQFDFNGNEIAQRLEGSQMRPPRDVSKPAQADVDRQFFTVHRLLGDMMQYRERYSVAKFKTRGGDELTEFVNSDHNLHCQETPALASQRISTSTPQLLASVSRRLSAWRARYAYNNWWRPRMLRWKDMDSEPETASMKSA